MSGAKRSKHKERVYSWHKKGMQHMRKYDHELLKMQGKEGPPKFIYPLSHGVITLQ
jgi:hypothetical protein